MMLLGSLLSDEYEGEDVKNVLRLEKVMLESLDCRSDKYSYVKM